MSLTSCGICEKIIGSGSSFRTKSTISQSFELVDSTGTKTVILIPMVHIGSAKDYHKIGIYLDGLRSRGFTVLYEGIGDPEEAEPTPEMDTILRKFRRIIGKDIFYGHDFQAKRRNEKWIGQDYDLVRIDRENDICPDMSITEIVCKYEEKFGPVILDSKDMKCPIGTEDYKRKRLCGESYVLRDIRDKKLLEAILDEKYQNIAVVYGSAHCESIKGRLIFKNGYRPRFDDLWYAHRLPKYDWQKSE